mgnify:CR=1 FL=1
MSYELKKSLDTVLDFLPDEKQTLLIVDDEDNNLQLLKRTFRGKYNILMAHNGLEALEAFDKCMRANGYPYALAYGTLLGAMREHNFIPHDDDLDLSMWIDDYDENLAQHIAGYGFVHKLTFLVDDGKTARQDTFTYKGVMVDISYMYRQGDDEAYQCWFALQPGCSTREESIEKFGGLLPKKLTIPYCRENEEIDFLGLKVFVPSNAIEVLQYRYGATWQTPIPYYREMPPAVSLWSEKVGVMTVHNS